MSPIHWLSIKADAIWWWMSYCERLGDLYFLVVSCLHNSNWRWNWFFHIGQQNGKDLKRRHSPQVKAIADLSEHGNSGVTHAGFPNMPSFFFWILWPSRIWAPPPSVCFSGPVTSSLKLPHACSNQVLSLGIRNGCDSSMAHHKYLLRLCLQGAISRRLAARVALLVCAETRPTEHRPQLCSLGTLGRLLPGAHDVLWEMPGRKVADKGHQAVPVALLVLRIQHEEMGLQLPKHDNSFFYIYFSYTIISNTLTGIDIERDSVLKVVKNANN